MRLYPRLIVLSAVVTCSCSQQPSHLLMPTSHGLCVLSAPEASVLVRGDLIVGPGELSHDASRSQLSSKLVLRSPRPILVTVLRDGEEQELLAARTGVHVWDGLEEVQRRCERIVRDLNDDEWRRERRARIRIAECTVDAARALAETSSAHSDASAQSAWIDREDGPRLFARSVGHSSDDPVVIVVNGGPGKSHDHLRILEVLADRGWTVVTYDQRGTGHSDRPVDDVWESYGFPEHASDLEAVREWTGHHRVVLLGHSWGGPLVLDYLSRHPEHVAGAVVVGSGAVTDASYESVSWGS
ncbi:MAG: hypothetical protein ACJAZO_003022, partial [Myxococcota bacterium]